MKRKGLMIFALATLLTACGREEPHMSPEEMAPIIADLHVADAWASIVRDTIPPVADKNYDSLAKWTAQIFARRGVSREAFEKSMDWYRDHPVELDSMYADIILMLEKQKE